MIKFILIVLLFILSYPAHSQIITISEELPLRNDYDYTILGWVGGDLMLFRDRGHQFIIQAFDEEMHLKWERELDLGENKADVIGIIAHPERIDLITGMREKGNYYIQHKSFDHSMSLIDTMTLGMVEKIFITPKIQMIKSEDESKVVLYREDNAGLDLISYDILQPKNPLDQ